MGAETRERYRREGRPLQAARSASSATAGAEFLAETVIIATGAQAKWLGLPSEEKFRGFGVSRLRDLRRPLLSRTRRVAVDGRRQHGGGGGAPPFAPSPRRSTLDPPPRRAAQRRRSCRSDSSPTRRSKSLWNREIAEVLGGESSMDGVTGVRLKDRLTHEHSPRSMWTVSSSPSATPRRPACSRASSTWTAAGYLHVHARKDRHAGEGRLRCGRRHRRRLPPSRHRRRAWVAWRPWKPLASWPRKTTTGLTSPSQPPRSGEDRRLVMRLTRRFGYRSSSAAPSTQRDVKADRR